jgi:hypothetical protein
MEVYKVGEKWALGLSGGHFEDMQKGAEAVIVNKHPLPVRMWKAKTVVDVQEEKGEQWEYDYTFKEHQGDETNIFFFEIKFTRYLPGYFNGSIEFFVTEEYIKEKTDFLRNNKILSEYKWDSGKGTWIEIERNFKYEDEEDEDEFFECK